MGRGLRLDLTASGELRYFLRALNSSDWSNLLGCLLRFCGLLYVGWFGSTGIVFSYWTQRIHSRLCRVRVNLGRPIFVCHSPGQHLRSAKRVAFDFRRYCGCGLRFRSLRLAFDGLIGRRACNIG